MLAGKVDEHGTDDQRQQARPGHDQHHEPAKISAAPTTLRPTKTTQLQNGFALGVDRMTTFFESK